MTNRNSNGSHALFDHVVSNKNECRTPTAVVIGAGPAGLTAAYELLAHTDIKPIVIESADVIGGISATYTYKNNRIDIGGHRFYSKDETIVKWWLNILPLQSGPAIDDLLLKRDLSGYFDHHGNDPEKKDPVMLIRPRLSRIFFRDKLFDYPLNISPATFFKLGTGLTFNIAVDYFLNRLHPISPEKNLEDFFINRFGRKLYQTFFKNYTEKVWGISCKEISREWGAQRVKGVSVSELIRHALFNRNNTTRGTETSLISRFYYPKRGPGQLWEEVARKITERGGELYTNARVHKIAVENHTITGVDIGINGQTVTLSPDYVFSSMPLKDLFTCLSPQPPGDMKIISDNLVYRDFIMTGILAKTMQQGQKSSVFSDIRLLPDTWIYIQDPRMMSGRLQMYNNWSPYMVHTRDTAWIGLEFFCNEGDQFWAKSDAQLIQLAIDELDAMNLVRSSDIIDGVCIKIKKTYPSYWGSYHRLNEVKKYLCSYDNLYCIGRNGLHRYNNMDHSMLTSIASVQHILGNYGAKEKIWDINSEDDYGEEK